MNKFMIGAILTILIFAFTDASAVGHGTSFSKAGHGHGVGGHGVVGHSVVRHGVAHGTSGKVGGHRATGHGATHGVGGHIATHGTGGHTVTHGAGGHAPGFTRGHSGGLGHDSGHNTGFHHDRKRGY